MSRIDLLENPNTCDEEEEGEEDEEIPYDEIFVDDEL